MRLIKYIFVNDCGRFLSRQNRRITYGAIFFIFIDVAICQPRAQCVNIVAMVDRVVVGVRLMMRRGRAMVSFVRGRMMSRAVMRGFMPAVMLTVAATWLVAHMATIALVMTGAAVLLCVARVVSMVAC